MDYFAEPGINWSTLKALDDSPLHYRHALEHGRPDTPALAFGRLAHLLTFEPESFDNEFSVRPDCDRRTKEGKAIYAAWLDTLGSRTEVTVTQVEEAQALARAVRTNPIVVPYLDGGIFEGVLQWTDERTGLGCKARFDWMQPRTRTLIDLKTAQNLAPYAFQGAVARYGYHGQLAHYAAGVEAVYGWQPDEVLIVGVEKAAPYDVGVFRLTDALDAGRRLRDQLLDRLLECREQDYWPGRYPTPVDLVLPAWAEPDNGIDFDNLEEP